MVWQTGRGPDSTLSPIGPFTDHFDSDTFGVGRRCDGDRSRQTRLTISSFVGKIITSSGGSWAVSLMVDPTAASGVEVRTRLMNSRVRLLQLDHDCESEAPPVKIVLSFVVATHHGTRSLARDAASGVAMSCGSDMRYVVPSPVSPESDGWKAQILERGVLLPAHTGFPTRMVSVRRAEGSAGRSSAVSHL
jgi:hypothetical protein